MTEATEQNMQLIAPTFKVGDNIFVLPEMIGVKGRDEEAIKEEVEKVTLHTDLDYIEMIDIDPTDFKHVKGEMKFTADDDANSVNIEVYMIGGEDFQSLYDSHLAPEDEVAA